MIDDNAFLSTVMEQPYEIGPLLVWADWLQERGDPRGELLAMWPAIVKEIKALPSSPGAGNGERTAQIKRLRSDPQRRLFAALQARYTPLTDGRLVGDTQTDVRSQRCVTAAALHAAGLVTREELAAEAAGAAGAAEAAWAAGAAEAAGAAGSAEAAEAAGSAEAAEAAWAAWAAGSARAAGAAGAAWAAWAAGAAEAARAALAAACRWQLCLATWLLSRKPLPTQVRRLLRTIHAGATA